VTKKDSDRKNELRHLRLQCASQIEKLAQFSVEELIEPPKKERSSGFGQMQKFIVISF
jgi:hypothetical protein